MAQNNYPDNRVITSRYTFITFVPFNLFEQFRRIANFYFLCMVIIQLSIDSPVSVTTSALPLVFVVSVTAVKQGYEDWLRHRGDRAVNNAMVNVVRRGCLQEVQSREVRVGEVLKLFENQPVPCDVLLLCSSDPDRLCHVTTANLDGETNLKTLRCPKILRNVGPEQLNRFRARIECDPPTSNLYTFHGKLEVLPDGPGPGILEPGSVGPAGDSSPVPERLTHRRVKSLGTVSENATNGQKSRPISIPLTELTGQNRRESLGTASPIMSRLGSLKRWSMRRFSSKRSPPTMIQVSTEMTEALDAENLLLRGATIRNTEYVYGCAIYTGQQTKLALNSRITRNKFSTIEKTVNKFLIFYLILLFVEVAICSGLKYGFEAGDWFKTLSYLPPRGNVDVGLVLQDVFSFVVLFNYIIPISLYVTMELQKFLGSLFFVWDVEMYSAELDEHAIANTSDLNEELGQVQYLFTDKTGTLTENDMVFRRCSVDGNCYEERSGHLLLLGPDGDPRRSLRTLTQLPSEVETFYLAVAVCHSVQVARPNDSGEIEYQASSPDEKALLESASRCGIVFLGEEGDKMRVMCRDRQLVYQRLDTIEFSSDRRRMSVIVKDHENHIWLVCKGAESTIIPLCSTGPKSETLKHVGDFATRGLRTLAIARRPLHPETWRRMRGELQRARQKVGPARAAAVDTASAALESDLSLLGASGVEDRLQPGVKVTLESLRAAGIKVWVLTGDKVETAINVSRSCGHLKPGTVQFEMVGHTEAQQCVESLQAFQERVNMEPLAQYGLVVDGNSLALALLNCPELLRDLCTACTAVLACRLSPLQKCEVVQLMKQAPGFPVTAAVGDGANDVSMIQEAHVGIGIVGKEGRQAVRSSDFAVPRFQHLRRALLVHGHWYYLRVATLVQYFFYKNVAFISAQFFFALASLFSTQSLYDSFYLTCFNVIYTSLPVLLYGLMEQDKPAETLLDFPENYRLHRDNALLTWSEFFLWTALGAWHALVTYYGPAILINFNSISLLSDGSDAGVWVMGAVVMHCVVFVTNLKLLLASRYWTFFFVGSIALSAFGFIGVTAAWCALFLNGSTGEMYWSYVVLMYSPAFWLLSIVLVVMCMIPDFAITAWRQMTPPHVLRRLVNITIRGGCKTGRAFKFIFYKNSGRLSISTTS